MDHIPKQRESVPLEREIIYPIISQEEFFFDRNEKNSKSTVHPFLR
jgi:hypothetical protein